MTTQHDQPYENPATQDERKAIVKNDSYFARQSHTVDDAGGRYATLTPSNVTGSTPSPQYPQLPASSPWSEGFDQNLEPELGLAVDEMPAVGTEKEVQASLEPMPEPPEVNASPPTVEDGVGEPADVSNLAASSVGSPIKRRRY